jgi:hypothetical protein
MSNVARLEFQAGAVYSLWDLVFEISKNLKPDTKRCECTVQTTFSNLALFHMICRLRKIPPKLYPFLVSSFDSGGSQKQVFDMTVESVMF